MFLTPRTISTFKISYHAPGKKRKAMFVFTHDFVFDRFWREKNLKVDPLQLKIKKANLSN